MAETGDSDGKAKAHYIRLRAEEIHSNSAAGKAQNAKSNPNQIATTPANAKAKRAGGLSKFARTFLAIGGLAALYFNGQEAISSGSLWSLMLAALGLIVFITGIWGWRDK